MLPLSSSVVEDGQRPLLGAAQADRAHNGPVDHWGLTLGMPYNPRVGRRRFNQTITQHGGGDRFEAVVEPFIYISFRLLGAMEAAPSDWRMLHCNIGPVPSPGSQTLRIAAAANTQLSSTGWALSPNQRPCPLDQVNRNFRAPRLNALWPSTSPTMRQQIARDALSGRVWIGALLERLEGDPS